MFKQAMISLMFVGMICMSTGLIVDTYINSTECKMCETMVNVIDYEYYNLNKSIDFILRVTEAICEQIPGPGAKECIYISDSLQNIISDLNCTMNASQICHNLTLC